MTDRRFHGRSAAERRETRRAQLLETALELIGEAGWPAATMTAVCRRAGLTERYFYESFENRETLYIALIDGVAAETRERVLAAAATHPDDRTERIRAVADALVGVLVTDPRKGRVALLEGLGDDVLARRRRDILSSFEELVHAEAVAFLGADHQHDDRALVVLGIALVGASAELIARRLDGTLRLSDAELAEAIAGIGERLATTS